MKSNIFAKVLLTVSVLTGAAAVRADYATIYWRVDPSVEDTFSYAYAGITYAPSVNGLGSDYLDNAVWGADEMTKATVIQDGIQVSTPGEASSYDGYSFRIDLFDGEYNLLAFSKVETLASLENSWHAVASGTGTKADGVWVGTTFTAVPEPTSGMLFLLGLASLALRRKRV